MLVWPNIPKRAITREKRVFAIELSDRYGRAFELHMARFSGGLKRRPCGNRCARPAHISRKSGTHIVQKQTGKGPAVRFVKRYIGSNARLAAIGDSAEDIAMLEACDYAYAASGCSQVVRQFAKKGGCHVLKQYRQAALLEAIHHRLRSDGVVLSKSSIPSSRLHSGHLIQKLLEVADRRPSI